MLKWTVKLKPLLVEWISKGKLTLASLKKLTIEFLKDSAIKLALLKFLGPKIAGGWKVWLVSFIVEKLFEELAEPIVKYFFRQIGYYYDRKAGQIKFKRIKEAREADDKAKYDIAVDDLFK